MLGALTANFHLAADSPRFLMAGTVFFLQWFLHSHQRSIIYIFKMYHYLLDGSQLHTIIYLFLVSIQIIRHHSDIFKPCFVVADIFPFL